MGDAVNAHNDENIWDSVKKVRGEVVELNQVVFGYWLNGQRVQGLIEQNNEIIKGIAERDKEFDKLIQVITETSWKIGKPLIIIFAILAAVGVLSLATHGGFQQVLDIFKAFH